MTISDVAQLGVLALSAIAIVLSPVCSSASATPVMSMWAISGVSPLLDSRELARESHCGVPPGISGAR